MVQQGKTKKEQRKTMEITLVQIAGAGAGMLTTKRGFNPFVDTVRERSESDGIRSDDHISFELVSGVFSIFQSA